MKCLLKGKFFDPLTNSFHLFLKEMYKGQCGEFVCVYWGLKGQASECHRVNHIHFNTFGGELIFREGGYFLCTLVGGPITEGLMSWGGTCTL